MGSRFEYVSVIVDWSVEDRFASDLPSPEPTGRTEAG